ncbi:hypothetical protein GCM10028806_12890 [Spirosoma terrae]
MFRSFIVAINIGGFSGEANPIDCDTNGKRREGVLLFEANRHYLIRAGKHKAINVTKFNGIQVKQKGYINGSH